MNGKRTGTAPPSVELFELLVQSAVDFGIFTTDEIGQVTSWNSGAERIFGYSEGEIMASTADVIFTPNDRAAGAPEAERAEARAEGRAQDERWHQRKDGSRLWGSGLLMPLRDGSGFAKIVRDRTAHRRSEQQLRENEARFRLLATSVPQLVFTTRHDGSRTWGSPQWIDFTGLGLEESLYHGWLEAIHKDDRDATLEAWQEAAEIGEYYVEHRVRRAFDGAYRWHQTRARPLNEAEPTAHEWIGTTTDIHHIRVMQDRQMVLMAELQHRTRNLLAVVQSIATQTARKSDTLAAFSQEFAGRLRALSRVQGLISRADQQVIDMRSLIAAELEAHVGMGEEDDKVLVEGPPVALATDAAQTLALAIHELTTNAAKYGALAQPEARLRVTWSVGLHSAGQRVELEWREAGVVDVDRSRRQGYGTEMIERALPHQLGASTELRFDEDGVICRIGLAIGEPQRGKPHG